MTKPWSERPLWEKCWLGPHHKVYLHAGRIIGYAGCGGFAFYDAAKLLPNYDKLRYENAVRDLTVYAPRERGDYELTAHAKKVLRVILGPAPDDPEYVTWWRGRMISVRMMRDEGTEPEFAAEPPVPLPEEPAAEPPQPKKKPARKRAAKG
jgi:hypothetical protein